MIQFEPAVLALAAALRSRGLKIATAESCTGGLIAAACTAVAGSSDWFERGFVTYSNEAKVELLGVPMALIQAHGAVSAEASASTPGSNWITATSTARSRATRTAPRRNRRTGCRSPAPSRSARRAEP